MVPLTIPATLLTRSPASDWVSGRITGIAPATAASKYRSTRAALGGLGEFAGVVGQQRLVGGDDGLARVERGEDQLAGQLDAADHLDDEVDVVAGDERRRRRWSAARPGTPRSLLDAAHGDTAQHHRGADAGLEVLGVLAQDAHDLAADVAEAEDRDTDRAMRRFGSSCLLIPPS